MDAGAPHRPPYEDDERLPEQKAWGRRAQSIAAVLWPSFLAAAIATMLFFAFVDPNDMGETIGHSGDLSRMTGYGLGFFFFWLIAVMSSAVSVFLITTARRDKRDREPTD